MYVKECYRYRLSAMSWQKVIDFPTLSFFNNTLKLQIVMIAFWGVTGLRKTFKLFFQVVLLVLEIFYASRITYTRIAFECTPLLCPNPCCLGSQEIHSACMHVGPQMRWTQPWWFDIFYPANDFAVFFKQMRL